MLPVLRDIIGKAPIRNYYEPCLGGGSVFFDLWEQVRVDCYLNDVNRSLIDCYRGVAECPHDVIEALCSLKTKPYEQIKERFNYQDPQTPIALKAARFLALNHCCFNGLWRVNRSGEFNVPVGRNSKQRENSLDTFDMTEILHASMALKSATLSHLTLKLWGECDPEKTMRPGDLVFFDPPYLDTFSGYSADGFTIANHEELREMAKRFAATGARVIVCGSASDITHQVYGEPAVRVTLQRTIGASKRGESSEVIYLY